MSVRGIQDRASHTTLSPVHLRVAHDSRPTEWTHTDLHSGGKAIDFTSFFRFKKQMRFLFCNRSQR